MGLDLGEKEAQRWDLGAEWGKCGTAGGFGVRFGATEA